MVSERNRTNLILVIIAGVLAVGVVIALTAYLIRSVSAATEGAAATDDASTPATTQNETQETMPDDEPSASATPTGEASELELAATGFSLVDPAGVEVFAYGWADDAQQAVAELTEAFGSAPEQRTEAGNGSTYPDYTVYAWSGFSLYDMVPIDGGPAREDYSQPSYVRVSSNTVGDIAITAEFDLEIGLPIADVRALGPDVETERGSGIRFVFAADRSSFSGGVPSYSAIADTDGDKVTAIMYFYYFGG